MVILILKYQNVRRGMDSSDTTYTYINETSSLIKCGQASLPWGWLVGWLVNYVLTYFLHGAESFLRS